MYKNSVLEASRMRWINENTRLEASRKRWIDENSVLEHPRRRWIDENSGLEVLARGGDPVGPDAQLPDGDPQKATFSNDSNYFWDWNPWGS